MTLELQLRFIILASFLSPENLHEDGEISNQEADAKYKVLMKRWRELEKQAGQKVDEEVPWDWYKLIDKHANQYYNLLEEENRLRWN